MKDTLVGAVVLLFFLTLALGLLYRVFGSVFTLPKRFTLLPYQRGVRLLGGKVDRVLEPGTYWTSANRRILPVDIRPRPFRFEYLPALTADGTPARLTVFGEYRISDPLAAVLATADLNNSIQNAIQGSVRSAISETSARSVHAEPPALRERLRELLTPPFAALGLDLATLEIGDLQIAQMQH